MVNHSGNAMQAFNQELIKCIEELKATKSSLDAQIEAEESEKVRLQLEVESMTNKISQLNESLGKKEAARIDYERTIQETESAYMKILESSQLLLNMVKREAACLDQTLSTSDCSNAGEQAKVTKNSANREPTASKCEPDNYNATCHKLAVVEHFRKKRSVEA